MRNLRFCGWQTALVIYDRQLRRRLANSDDMATNQSNHPGAGDMRGASGARPVLLRMDDKIGEQRQAHGYRTGALRCCPVAAHVSATVPHLSRDAAALETVHRRIIKKHRCPESDQLQYEVNG